jgi:hypothetical protein
MGTTIEGSISRGQGPTAANRQQGDVHRAQMFDFALGRHIGEIPQMGDRQAVEVKEIKGVARVAVGFVTRFIFSGHRDPGDEDAPYFKLARTAKFVSPAAHRTDVAVAAGRVADGDDVGAQFERRQADTFIVWIGNDGGHAAFDHSKAGKAMPGKFHFTSYGPMRLYTIQGSNTASSGTERPLGERLLVRSRAPV